MDNTTAYLVDYAMDIAYERLSQASIEASKARVLDTLGCAFGAYRGETSMAARDFAHNHSGKWAASVLGSAQRTTADMAAFANGVMMRYLDMNDMYRDKSGGHPSDVIAAILAVGEAVHADGRSFIAAVAIGYEIYCSFCESVDINTKGWDQPVYGVLAAAIACGKLFGLSRDQMSHAVSLALVPNMALMQTRRGELSSWKGCAAANASRNGVFAALLAHGGFTGPGEIFEGRNGLWHIVGKFDWGPLDATKSPDRVTNTHLKCFPLGYHGQSAAWAALEIRDRIPIDQIAEIKIETYREAVDMMGSDPSKWTPKTRETADHSLPYVVATVLLDGDIGDESFSAEKLKDERTLGVMSKIHVFEDTALSAQYPEASPCRLSIRTTEGRVVDVCVQYPKGHARNALDRAGIESKFRKMSRSCIDETRATAIIDRIATLDRASDVGDLLKLAVF
ncbi:MAG: MmgE/PrpD family protein [Betaproteobacteria bacterium]|nr:MmgE/PrpD family protein [Betaproteobacteria bacterium]MBI3053535.1 MmgE/PrpD family protein [Betaproteobacteria bacterium]